MPASGDVLEFEIRRYGRTSGLNEAVMSYLVPVEVRTAGSKIQNSIRVTPLAEHSAEDAVLAKSSGSVRTIDLTFMALHDVPTNVTYNGENRVIRHVLGKENFLEELTDLNTLFLTMAIVKRYPASLNLADKVYYGLVDTCELSWTKDKTPNLEVKMHFSQGKSVGASGPGGV